MLVSLLLASALLAPADRAPQPVLADAKALIGPGPPQDKGLITWVDPLRCSVQTSLARQDGKATGTRSPMWTPKDFPDAGWYSTVERRVEGCAVPVVKSLDLRGK